MVIELIILIILILILLKTKSKETFQNKPKMGLYSNTLYDGGILKDRYTCEGQLYGDLSNISPDFYWKNIDSNALSFVVIMEDTTDKKNKITHWIVWNISRSSQLEENDKSKISGMNDFNYQGYTGPCKDGNTKQFTFTLYALNIMNLYGLKPNKTKKNDLLEMIRPHILETAKLVVYL